MEILTGSRNFQVFDNAYSKPPQMGDGPNVNRSVSVLFACHGTIFQGQYSFTDTEWHVHTGSAFFESNLKLPAIPDRDVDYWFHTPEFEKVLKDTINLEKSNGHPMKCRNQSVTNQPGNGYV